MRIDFHSHFPSPDSIVCTAEPCPELLSLPEPDPARPVADTQCTRPSLMLFQGLLPDRWTEAKQAQLFSLLASDKHIHLGEVGLDKRFSDLIPMQIQADILRSELEFALQNGKNICLHCVRATGLMLEILGGLTLRPFSVIWHGFTGSAETARQLAGMNIIISIGPRFTGAISDIYGANPDTVPETDYEGTDAREHRQMLESQYTRFERELNLSGQNLETHCENVFRKLNTTEPNAAR